MPTDYLYLVPKRSTEEPLKFNFHLDKIVTAPSNLL
jgi:hypothetical protein